MVMIENYIVHYKDTVLEYCIKFRKLYILKFKIDDVVRYVLLKRISGM